MGAGVWSAFLIQVKLEVVVVNSKRTLVAVYEVMVDTDIVVATVFSVSVRDSVEVVRTVIIDPAAVLVAAGTNVVVTTTG